jgi:hypothetical protein
MLSLKTWWPSVFLILLLITAATGAQPEILILVVLAVLQVVVLVYRLVDFTVGEAKARSKQERYQDDN